MRLFFKNKTAEQTFSICLLISIVFIMLFCAIVRLCGGLWFAADMSKIVEQSKLWQEVIKGALLVVELLFVYKILCRTSWLGCFVIAVAQSICVAIIVFNTNNSIICNIFNLLCYFIIPLIFVKHWFSLIESAILYILELAYSALFLVGRIGGINTEAAYSFVASILGTIDYKLFIVSLYFVIKFLGGIKLWKTQKRLIFQVDLRIKKDTE